MYNSTQKYTPNPLNPLNSTLMCNEICQMHHMHKTLKLQFPSILSYAMQICHMCSKL